MICDDAHAQLSSVMPALGAGIHVLLFLFLEEDVDGRDKPGHDDRELGTR
jgi:hypothetical protein